MNGGGELFLDTEDNLIGPGHMSIFSENGTDYFGYHFYDGNANGASKYNIEELAWTLDGWPIPASDVIPGDFNGNLIVDSVDLGLWRTHYGEKADGRDFLDWQRNFGVTINGLSAVAAVPEPQALMISFFGGLALLPGRIGRFNS
jgi:hypothetical protein